MIRQLFRHTWLGLVLVLAACNLRPTPAPLTSEGTPRSTLPESQGGTTIYGIHLPKKTSQAQIDLLAGAFAEWTRRDLPWALIEPQEGDRRWEAVAQLENELIYASSRGIQVILIVNDTPTWALKEGYPCGAVAAEKLAAFGAFLSAAVERYSAPPYHIQYWELWNEPDVQGTLGCWGDPEDAYYGGGYYARMLETASPHIKGADPLAQVLVGGLLMDCDPRDPPPDPSTDGGRLDCTPARFLEGILASQGGAYFDGVSFHAYDFYGGELGKYGNANWHSAWDRTGPVLITKSRFIQNLLGQYGHPDKYLMNTEVAVICGRTGNEDACLTEQFSTTKASYIAQSYSAAAAVGLRANLWYNLTGWRGSGLVSPELEISPAYQAFQTAARLLDVAQYVGPVTRYPNVSGHEFRVAQSAIWVLWSADGSQHTISLPVLPSFVQDVFGDPLPLVQGIEIRMEPRYVRWDLP